MNRDVHRVTIVVLALLDVATILSDKPFEMGDRIVVGIPMTPLKR